MQISELFVPIALVLAQGKAIATADSGLLRLTLNKSRSTTSCPYRLKWSTLLHGIKPAPVE